MNLFSFHHNFGVVHFLSHPFLLLLPELAAGTCYNGSHNLHSLCLSKKKVPIFCRGTWVFPFVGVGCRCPCRGGMSLPLSGWVVGSPSRLPLFRDGGSATPRTSHAHPTHAARLGGARPHAHPTRIPRTQPGLGERDPTRNAHARTSPKPGCPPRAVHRSSHARTSPKPGCPPRTSHARPTLPTHPLSPP